MTIFLHGISKFVSNKNIIIMIYELIIVSSIFFTIRGLSKLMYKTYIKTQDYIIKVASRIYLSIVLFRFYLLDPLR